jgi:hypothetical protein
MPLSGLFLLLDQFDDLALVGESPQPVLRKYELPLVLDFKDPSTGRDQVGVDAKAFLQIFRQTSGFRFVVSLGAVRDFADPHIVFPPRIPALVVEL